MRSLGCIEQASGLLSMQIRHIVQSQNLHSSVHLDLDPGYNLDIRHGKVHHCCKFSGNMSAILGKRVAH